MDDSNAPLPDNKDSGERTSGEDEREVLTTMPTNEDQHPTTHDQSQVKPSDTTTPAVESVSSATHTGHELKPGPVHSQKIDTLDMEDLSLASGDPTAPTTPKTPRRTDDDTEFQDAVESSPESPIGASTPDVGDAEQPTHTSLPKPPPIPQDEEDRPSGPTRTISEGLSRKVTGTLSWFSRASKTAKPTASPSRQASSTFPAFGPRRSTNSSMSTERPAFARGSEQEGSPHRQGTLQDRFMALRSEEERKEQNPSADSTPITEALKSPPLETPSEGDLKSPGLDGPTGRSRAPTAVDSKLPPGTAAGLSMGPSTEEDTPVNWDLWQNLVNEGPAAMSKTSGEALNSAIQSGIPATIRGVVWQVLADSKSEHLESVYYSLLGKEDPNLFKSPPLSRGNSISHVNVNGEKESLASSASSIHSHTSTPATSTNATSPPPTTMGEPSNDDDEQAREPQSQHIRKKSMDHSIAVQKLERTIRKDLGARTAYSKYLASAGLQEGLFGICKAYALYDESIGYAQGMNFIAMPLLFNMPEEEAFTLFVKMMSKYDLRSMFVPDMAGLHLRLYQFERLLEDFEPALYCHLHRRGVSPILYATQWFLTLFAYRFPLQLVQRAYDLILSEGLSAVLKFGIVLMRKNAKQLLEMKDMAQLSVFLKEKLFDVYIDKSPSASSILDSGFFGLAGGVDKEIYHADALIRDACAVEISQQTLSQYEAEFEEKNRADKAREAEVENLRISNSTLAAKLRNLESRVQQQDNDHVGLASDLIRTKVDNEALTDSNESLKIQVEELRKVVEKQPAEVEERLKDEMSRIMARNMEVQNSNRALEDSMQEMEQELVGTKMQYAQLNAEYEDLRQKLSNIQNLLGGGGAALAAGVSNAPSPSPLSPTISHPQ